jgi:hypothetical protein
MTDLLTRIEQNKPVEAQELYDYIVEAIVKQGRPSVGDNDRCLYRGPEGLKCAAGHVIPDSMYSENMENNSILSVFEAGSLPISLAPHRDLIQKLQNLHDKSNPCDSDGRSFAIYFHDRANQIAQEQFNLKPYGGKA